MAFADFATRTQIKLLSSFLLLFFLVLFFKAKKMPFEKLVVSQEDHFKRVKHINSPHFLLFSIIFSLLTLTSSSSSAKRNFIYLLSLFRGVFK